MATNQLWVFLYGETCARGPTEVLGISREAHTCACRDTSRVNANKITCVMVVIINFAKETVASAGHFSMPK